MPQFNRETFSLLRNLAANNDKAWMEQHRASYHRHVRDPAREVAVAWTAEMAPHGYQRIGTGVSPMHHDRRFAPGPPYRTHVAIRLRHNHCLPGAPGPTMLLWLAPRASFLAIGVHQHNAESLRRIRAAILAQPKTWRQVAGLGTLDDSNLAARTIPGPADLEVDLRRKHFTITRPLRQTDLTNSGTVEQLGAMSYEMLPFARFMEAALYPA